MRAVTKRKFPSTRSICCATSRGLYPAEFKTWEEAVLTAEIKRNGFKFWYRNPGRPSQDSLGISYADGEDVAIARPDFIFFAQQDDKVVVDIIDPHGFHFAAALPKSRGLARYAKTHPGVFRRVEAIAEVGGKMRVLDLTRVDARLAVMKATSAESLYKSAVAGNYP